MDKKLFKDALFVPSIGKLTLRLHIGKIHFKVIEPYNLTVSVCNYEEAVELLRRIGLGDLPLSVIEDTHAVSYAPEPVTIGQWDGIDLASLGFDPIAASKN